MYWPLSGPVSEASASLAAIETVAVSSSVIVTVALSAPPSIEICGSPELMLSSVTITVSDASTMSSSRAVRSIVAVVEPAVIVTWPDSGVKSSPEVAVPVTV